MRTLTVYLNICGYLLDKKLQEQEIEIAVEAGILHDETRLRQAIAAKLSVPPSHIIDWRYLRKSLDARGRLPVYRLRLLINPSTPESLQFAYTAGPLSAAKKEALVIGFGPAGMFAALELLKQGIRPIILERGVEVRLRRRDLVRIYRDRRVDPDSNYCFGEGGAGTFSDGKLYTRSNKRGSVRAVLETFVQFGANPDILADARPHIGTNKLPEIVENIRMAIIAAGGEVHFNTRVDDILLERGTVTGVSAGERHWPARSVILATGHSARDVFEMLHRLTLKQEAKPFALGVRLEHPQELIDKLQYKCDRDRHKLPAAYYNLIRQVDGKGVFSFCMCPGGIVAPAMTNPEEVVVNGWSPSKRGGHYANSGFVVQVAESDWKGMDAPEPLKAMKFQQSIEHAAFIAGGSDLRAPAQTISDFVQNRLSGKVIHTSYLPGVLSADLRTVLPGFISERMARALKHFGKIMPGFSGPDGVMLGVESRTSSPVKIPRDGLTLQHPEALGLFPCGEGAGYAGGIVSAALDGIACADRVAERLRNGKTE